MELLRLEHLDFMMTIECTKFDAIWRKAKGNVGEEHLTSTYSWSEGVVSVERLLEDGKSSESILKDVPAPAIFFDNTDYPIWIDFKENSHVKGAKFCSVSQSDNERFAFRRGLLAGFLNYGNEIGRSEINFEYDTDKGKRRFSFSFEVLSTKLDYHSHWKKIVEDIEQEYHMLSLDFLKRTFHSFSPDANGETPEIIWWSIFAAEQKKFLNACKNIIERPRHRLHGREAFLRADKLRRIPMSLENEIAEHRREPARLYRVEEQVQSNDTQENRFLKYALGQITDRYAVLKERILKVEGVSDTTRKELDDTFLAQLDSGSAFACRDAQSSGFRQHDFDSFVINIMINCSGGITSSANTSYQIIRIIPSFMLHQLTTDFFANDGLQTGNHVGIRMRSDSRTNQIIGVFRMTTPITDGFVRGVLQCHVSRSDRNNLRSQHLHLLHIGMLAFHIRFPHINNTFHVH